MVDQTSADGAAVRVQGITKHYAGKPAVQDISFEARPGKLLALLGPSGCGKTTILRVIAGLAVPTAGEVHIGGRRATDVPVHRRNVAVLFQNYALFPHLTVAQNVAFGLRMRRCPRPELQRRVAEALALVRLEAFESRLPSQLSGGQQQRVALARALVVRPAVLLLDEPFAALDRKLRESMQVEFSVLQRSLGLTTLLVTHDQEEAFALADEIAVMRDGTIQQFGTASDIIERPATRFVADFVGTTNFVEGKVAETLPDAVIVTGDDGLRLRVAPHDGAAHIGDRVVAAIRPGAITIEAPQPDAPHENSLHAEVAQIAYRGILTHCYLAGPGGRMLTAVSQQRPSRPDGTPIQPGDRVLARWPAEAAALVRDD